MVKTDTNDYHKLQNILSINNMHNRNRITWKHFTTFPYCKPHTFYSLMEKSYTCWWYQFKKQKQIIIREYEYILGWFSQTCFQIWRKKKRYMHHKFYMAYYQYKLTFLVMEKLFPCLTKYHTMKTYTLLNLSTMPWRHIEEHRYRPMHS